jgi:hypothetical protein
MRKHESLMRLAISSVLALSGAVIASNAICPRDMLERNGRKGMNAKTDFTLSFDPEAWEYSVVSHKALGNDYGSPVRA